MHKQLPSEVIVTLADFQIKKNNEIMFNVFSYIT